MITTAGVARNDAGAFFIARRKPSKNLDSCWEFPGGKAAPGEPPDQALKREYREEFGIDIEVGELLCTGSFTNKTDEYELKAFSITLLGEPECREHIELSWKTIAELKSLEFVPSDHVIIKRLRNRTLYDRTVGNY